MINGHNGINGYARRENMIVVPSDDDAGARHIPPPPCARRLEHGGWCALVNGHDGACEGPPRKHGPLESLWHRHRGLKVPCDNKRCSLTRGHVGKCR